MANLEAFIKKGLWRVLSDTEDKNKPKGTDAFLFPFHSKALIRHAEGEIQLSPAYVDYEVKPEKIVLINYFMGTRSVWRSEAQMAFNNITKSPIVYEVPDLKAIIISKQYPVSMEVEAYRIKIEWR